MVWTENLQENLATLKENVKKWGMTQDFFAALYRRVHKASFLVVTFIKWFDTKWQLLTSGWCALFRCGRTWMKYTITMLLTLRIINI